MASKDLSASDFMARTSQLLARSSAEGAVAPPQPAPAAGGSLAQRTDDLLARTAALLGKPIPNTPMPTAPMPVAESMVYSPEPAMPTMAPPAAPAGAGSFAQRSSDLLARTAQLLGRPVSSESVGAADVSQYAMSPPPQPAYSQPAYSQPAYSPPPAMPAPAGAGGGAGGAEGSFAQRSADLLAKTAALLGKPPVAQQGGYDAMPQAQPLMTAPPAMQSLPPPMPAPMPPSGGGAPQGGSLSKRADDLLARTAALLGNKAPVMTPAPASYEPSMPAALPVSLPPSVEASVQGNGSGSFAERSNDLLARTAQLLGRNPSTGAPPPPAYEPSHAPMMAPPPSSYSPPPYAMPQMPPPPPAPEGGGNFAQRSADVLARTAQLLNKSESPAPKLELLEMLRRAPPVGGSTA